VNARSAGRQTLSELEQRAFDSHQADMAALDERIAEATEDEARSQIPASLHSKHHTAPAGVSGRPGVPNTAGRLAPLGFGHDEMRRLQGAAQRGDPCRLETRAFSTADSLIPAQLFPYVTEHIHESRLLDRLPGISFDTPSITFIRHVSTTGAAAPTTEGGLKPELVFVTDALTEPAIKIAGNVGLPKPDQ
jgi:hypothetical protein